MANKQDLLKQAQRLVNRLEDEGCEVILLVQPPKPVPKPKILGVHQAPTENTEEVGVYSWFIGNNVGHFARSIITLARRNEKFLTLLFHVIEGLAPQTKAKDQN